MNAKKNVSSMKIVIALTWLLALPFTFGGCGGSGGGASGDVGDNNPDLVACMGDSITSGYNSAGAPYPSRLAVMSGKTVLNFGVPGAQSSYGTSLIGSVVNRKPGYVFILYGSNDAINGTGPDTTKQHLRYIISVCKANSCVPILATPPKMALGHAVYDGAAAHTATAIRELAKEEGVALVDLYKAFGDGIKYLNPDDGLHLSDEGGDFIAKKFNSKI